MGDDGVETFRLWVEGKAHDTKIPPYRIIVAPDGEAEQELLMQRINAYRVLDDDAAAVGLPTWKTVDSGPVGQFDDDEIRAIISDLETAFESETPDEDKYSLLMSVATQMKDKIDAASKLAAIDVRKVVNSTASSMLAEGDYSIIPAEAWEFLRDNYAHHGAKNKLHIRSDTIITELGGSYWHIDGGSDLEWNNNKEGGRFVSTFGPPKTGTWYIPGNNTIVDQDTSRHWQKYSFKNLGNRDNINDSVKANLHAEQAPAGAILCVDSTLHAAPDLQVSDTPRYMVRVRLVQTGIVRMNVKEGDQWTVKSTLRM